MNQTKTFRSYEQGIRRSAKMLVIWTSIIDWENATRKQREEYTEEKAAIGLCVCVGGGGGEGGARLNTDAWNV